MRFEGHRVYLTGATGFIGGALARRLLDEGADLTCLVRPTTPAKELERLGATIVRGDVTQPETLDLSGHDLAIHAAAWVAFAIPKNKIDVFRETNIQGTRNVVQAAERADLAKFVHLSSVAALGRPTAHPITEATPPAPIHHSEYERTKAEAHQIVLHSHLRTTLPMPGLVVGAGGPFQPIFRALANRRIPALPGDDATKGWVHIDDVVDATLAAALKGEGPYLLVDENMRTTELMIAGLEEAGLPLPRWRFPSRILTTAGHVVEATYKARGKIPPLSGEMLEALTTPMEYDSTKARKDLAWRPDLVKKLGKELAAYAAQG